MSPLGMKYSEITHGVYHLEGAVNGGALVQDGRAILIDCDSACTPAALRELGVQSVERILCTQHHRVNTAGMAAFTAAGATLTVPRTEEHLFNDVETYWNAFGTRWHIYSEVAGPQVLPYSVKVDDTVAEGDSTAWEGFEISVIETPGATDGAVSYVVHAGEETVVFCGDAIYGPGQVYDIYSLQKGFKGVSDYHGFLGNWLKLEPTLRTIRELDASVLVPSHGDLIRDPASAIDLTLERLEALNRNHASISSMNYYFPRLYKQYADDPERMQTAELRDPPPCVLRPGSVSFLLRSETGAGLLVDCGMGDPLGGVRRLIEEGELKTLEVCWITHYHDDHVHQIDELPGDVALWTHECIRDLIEHPIRYRLPCISPRAALVTRAFAEGESWDWHEFRLTTMHLPGQTYYHNGLLVEGQGIKILFAGDSGSPRGIDDHCTQNRVLTGEGRGFRRVIEIWREHQPDYIFNQHQENAFRFTAKQLDHMESVLVQREALYRELLPWEEPDFGIDPHWIRTYPYEQDALAGSICGIEVQFTNHATEARVAEIDDAMLPDGWSLETEGRSLAATIPARTDGGVRVYVSIPAGCERRKFILPVSVTWNGQRLGPIRHAVVNVL
jgi:glyoxylase-like metal-dependent hydrolase (beta-lactamase superfamily II)